MDNAITNEIRNAAQFMAVDELGNLWLSGDGLKMQKTEKTLTSF